MTIKEQLRAAAYALALKTAGLRDFRIETCKQLNIDGKYLARALVRWKAALDPVEIETVIAAIAPSLSPEALKALQPYFKRDKSRGHGWAITPFDPARVITKKQKPGT